MSLFKCRSSYITQVQIIRGQHILIIFFLNHISHFDGTVDFHNSVYRGFSPTYIYFFCFFVFDLRIIEKYHLFVSLQRDLSIILWSDSVILFEMLEGKYVHSKRNHCKAGRNCTSELLPWVALLSKSPMLQYIIYFVIIPFWAAIFYALQTEFMSYCGYF